MVARQSDYRRSSYQANAHGKDDPLVTAHAEYDRLGRDGNQRRRAYRALFHSYIDDDVVRGIRNALNQEFVFADEQFKDQIEAHLSRQARPRKRGRPKSIGKL